MAMNGNCKYLREEYTARVNRVIDYIENRIDRELSLKELSEVAGFSPFHFHRIFAALVGETLNSFIQRIRVEKAASMLIQNPKKSITEIALDCGFSGASTFARAFKDCFGISASQWRAGGYLDNSRNCITDSNIRKTDGNFCKDFTLSTFYNSTTNKQIWRVEMKTGQKFTTEIEVREIPEIHVAYVRNIGPYAKNEKLFERLINKLCAWAGPRGLLQRPDAKILAVYHDNPDITDEKNLRTDICVTIPPETKVDGEIGKSVIPAGKYAVAHFELASDQYADAWNAIYGGWLPESGYQPDDRPCFELYLKSPKEHPEHKCVVDIYVAVKPF
jgi:AraC family transcriptional regulator